MIATAHPVVSTPRIAAEFDSREKRSSRREQPTNGQPPAAKKQRNRKPWAPSENDHLVYQLVKFGGKTQDLVASMQRVSQATVSRILQRYEKWLAHAQPGTDGRLDPAERSRAQLWLTYERNEKILASCLRIADEMEGMTDLWKTVKSQPLDESSPERVLRSENTMIDRTGVASRFLRLAFRVNMEQLKLADREPLAHLPPLEEEFEDEEAEANAEGECGGGDEAETEESTPLTPSGTGIGEDVGEPNGANEEDPDAAPLPHGVRELHEPPPLKLHNVHKSHAADNGASDDAACACDTKREKEKRRNPA